MNHFSNLLLRWAAASLLTFGAFISLAQDRERNNPSALPSNIALWNLPDGAKLRLGKGTIGPDYDSSNRGALAFSRNGDVLAVAGGVGVWLYDAKTGAEIDLLRGHTGIVNYVDYSQDGRALLTAGNDKTARLWNAETGALRHIFGDPSKSVHSAALSPDGRTVATGASASIDLWSADTGKHFRTLVGDMRSRGHGRGVYSLAYSPDGKLLASVSDQYDVRIWNAETGAQLHYIKGIASGGVMLFSPDSQTLVCSGKTYSHVNWPLRIVDPQKGAVIRSIYGHTRTIHAAAFSPDGKKLVSGGDDASIRIWDAVTGAPLRMIGKGEDHLYQTAYSPDSKTLIQIASGAGDLYADHIELIRILDSESGALIQTIVGPDQKTNYIIHALYSPNSDEFACRQDDYSIWIFSMRERKALRIIKDQKYGVSTISYSPDGKILASGSYAGPIQLWNPDTGENIRTLHGHANAVGLIVFSRDGRYIASAGRDTDDVWIWDIETGENIQTLEGHGEYAYDVRFSADGKHVVTKSYNFLRIWNVNTGAQEQTIDGNGKSITEIAYSPDRKEIAVAYTLDGDIKIWSIEKGMFVQTLKGHTKNITALTYSPDGRLLLSGSWDYTVRIWDPDTGKTLHTLKHGHLGHWVDHIDFFPDEDTIATRSNSSVVLLWSAETGEFLRTIPETLQDVHALAYSPDGKIFASHSCQRRLRMGGTIDIWSADNGKRLRTIRGHTEGVRSIAFSPDGKQVASGGYNGDIRIWDASAGKLLQTTYEPFSTIYGMGYSPDGKTVAAACRSDYGGILTIDAQTGERIHMSDQKIGGNFAAFSPDGSMMATGGTKEEGQIRIWDMNARKTILSTAKDMERIESAAFSPDGKWIATGGKDNTLRVWSVETGLPIHTPKAHPGDVLSVAFSPDGERIATGCYDKGVRIWGAVEGAFLISEQMHDRAVLCVAYSPDGKTLASASADYTVRLWNARNGKHIRTFTGHTDEVNSLAFSRDGKTLASGSLDGTVLLWDLSNLPSVPPP
ncbi:MAG: WD40 repeat domain-containing protein [Candidatus Poribacteria bacterium]|nr:WD40 repeat domain-containing protein [Candidatus Poribacteria bacterium]